MELKRCPFCGGEAEFYRPDHGDYPDDTWAVICEGGYRDKPNECGAETCEYPTKEEAAAAWNRRAADEAAKKAREALSVIGPRDTADEVRRMAMEALAALKEVE